MKIIGGNPIWTNINSTPQRYSSLKNDITTDILVVGGGVTGAICAYYLNNAGIKTVLIDENLIGLGSTATCTSILQYDIDLDLIGLSKKIGEENANRAFTLCKEAVHTLEDIIKSNDLDCSFSKVPALYYTQNPDDFFDMKKEYNLRKNIGINVQFITDEDCHEFCPFPISSGILSKDDSSLFDPYLFTIEILQLSNSKGLKIYEKTKIKESLKESQGYTFITEDNFKIKANKILICTGYNAASLFKEPIADFSRTFNIVTSPIKNPNPLWQDNMIFKDNKKYYTYIRTTLDNRIILGGEDIVDLNYDSIKIDAAYDRLLGQLRGLFPKLNGYTIDFKFNGIFADTKDNLPYIGEHPDFPDHYFCLGYGANGIIYSIIGGQLLVDLYNGNYSSDLEIFKFRR